MIKNYDVTSTDKVVYTQYNQIATQQGLMQAQQYIQDNNYIEYALVATYFNEIIDVISSGDNNLQEFHIEQVLKYIGTPPIQWIRGNNYIVGDKVYLTTELDEYIYLCIKNITNSTNVNNQQYWLKISNYYTPQALTYIYQTWIDRFKVETIPEWEANTTYYKNNIVTYEGETYVCIDATTEGTTASTTDVTKWLKLALRGVPGTSSLGLIYGGDWVNGQEYNKNTLVIYNSDIYVSLAAITNVTIPPSESTEWLKVSTKAAASLYCYTIFTPFTEPLAFWRAGNYAGRLMWNISGRSFFYVTDKWSGGQIDWRSESQIQNFPVNTINITNNYVSNYITVTLYSNAIDSTTHTAKVVVNLVYSTDVGSNYRICNGPAHSIGYYLKVKLGNNIYNSLNYQSQPLFPLVNCKYVVELQLNDANTIITGINNYQFIELPNFSYLGCNIQTGMSITYIYNNWRQGQISNTTYTNTLLKAYYDYYILQTQWS